MVSYINIAGVTEYLNCLIKLTMTGQGAQQGIKEGKSGRTKTRDCRELWLDRILPIISQTGLFAFQPN